MARLIFVAIGLAFFWGNQAVAEQKKSWVDPMRPAHYRVSAPTVGESAGKVDEVNASAWQLTAVLVSPSRSVAVINGASFQVGDVLEGYKIISINPQSVVLKSKAKKLVLKRSGTGLRKDTVQ